MDAGSQFVVTGTDTEDNDHHRCHRHLDSYCLNSVCILGMQKDGGTGVEYYQYIIMKHTTGLLQT
jgi:hypothetical protein